MGAVMGGFTVATTMKNEGAFLVEWLAHHKALGFDHVVICTNDCEDATRDMALRLQAMGLVRHHATKIWPVTGIQRSALKQIRRYGEVTGADWLWVCDADEFLVVKIGDGTVQALAAAASDAARVISVPWRVFAPQAGSDVVRGAVTRACLRAEPHTGGADAGGPVYCKSLLRGLEGVHRIGIHTAVAREGEELTRELPGGVAHVPQHHPMFVAADYRVAQVNHYALRSRGSFLVKRARGRVNHASKPMEIDYWDRFDVEGVPCHAIRRYDDAATGWTARLMADRKLAALHHAAVEWHAVKAAQLAAQEDHAGLVAALDAWSRA